MFFRFLSALHMEGLFKLTELECHPKPLVDNINFVLRIKLYMYFR